MKRALNSLRYRFFLALGVVLLMALLALGVIAKVLVIPALLAKEEEYASQELDRAERAINNELKHLSLLNNDWAVWDDSYDFMQGKSPDYLETNLAEGLVFKDANLRLIAFFNPDGSPYWLAGINPGSGEYTSCSSLSDACQWTRQTVQALSTRIQNDTTQTRQTWLQASPERALVSLNPVLRSDGSGPIVGWMAMVRSMNESWFARLEESTGLPLKVRAVRDLTTAWFGTTIERIDEKSMLATRGIAALPQGYHLRLQATLPRQGFKASLETFRFALYWTIGLIIVVVSVVLILLERMILSPLRQFAAFTQQVQSGKAEEPPSALLRRRDEIGTLAREFQQLLELQRRQTSSLVELSHHDPLTGLANRRLFDQTLEETLQQAHLHSQPMGLLMVDIDSFKNYNDHFGHPAGDACLKAIADAMQRHFLRPNQLVARTGGEEFSIVLPGSSEAVCARLAESLRQAIEALGLPHPASEVSPVVTVSVGVACSAPEQPRSPQELVDAADAALYAAKQAGRNQVSMEGEQATA
ncbi:diguanylate cyclase domain-containing protein [Modicisalibacter xianhensis]|uniref:diguanylate cyclase n=1 Tax=Modicisalibacter xianhensis TaxID=442341 RepID=A0A1I3ABX8_9GAMM|nr:diguanylate cyclase [Halomonas xianhensis]SFH47597.1 diguanylate cyclase (GGDEF) domain-containing protein [Halomonas xianhensis]